MIGYSPALPWNDSVDNRLLRQLLIGGLSVFMVLALFVIWTDLPDRPRQELEEIPPQLAKMLKKDPPKPKPKPEVKKIEPKPEQPKELPKEKVKPPEPPKPKPKPIKKPKINATDAERAAAKEKVKKALGNDALAALAALQSQVPNAALATASGGLSQGGKAATSVGSVVNRIAASSGTGGIDTTALTSITTGEALEGRSTTEIELTEREIALAMESRERSAEEVRLAFEGFKTQYDRIYRSSLRSNPNIEGSVTLALSISPAGGVTTCSAKSKEIKDSKMLRRLESKCRQMQFESKPDVALAKVEFPIRFKP